MLSFHIKSVGRKAPLFTFSGGEGRFRHSQSALVSLGAIWHVRELSAFTPVRVAVVRGYASRVVDVPLVAEHRRIPQRGTPTQIYRVRCRPQERNAPVQLLPIRALHKLDVGILRRRPRVHTVHSFKEFPVAGFTFDKIMRGMPSQDAPSWWEQPALHSQMVDDLADRVDTAR